MEALSFFNLRCLLEVASWAECSSLHNEQFGDARVRSSAVLARDSLIRGASLLSQVGSTLTWAEFLQFSFQFGNCESFEWDSTTRHAITARLFSCAQVCSRGIGDYYGCLPACRILDRTNCSSFTGQNLLCSLLQWFQQYIPPMVFRLHLSKPRFALNGISTRTVKCGKQDAFGNRVDCNGQ